MKFDCKEAGQQHVFAMASLTIEIAFRPLGAANFPSFIFDGYFTSGTGETRSGSSQLQDATLAWILRNEFLKARIIAKRVPFPTIF